MPDPIVLAEAICLAAIVAVAIAWLVGRAGLLGGGAVGAGIGILAGWWLLGAPPRIPPREALDRFLVLLAPVAIIAELLIARDSQLLKRIGWGLRATVAALAAPVLIHGSSYVTDLSGPGSREWSTGNTVAIFATLAVAFFFVQTAMTLLANRASQSTSLALAVTIGGAAVTIMLSGYASGGQLGFPLAAAVGVFAIFISRNAPGATAITVVGLFSLLLVGRLFAGLTTLNAALLFAAPLLAWAPEMPWLRRYSPRARGAMRMVVTAIPVALALWLAQQKFAADSAGPTDNAGESSLNDYLQFGK